MTFDPFQSADLGRVSEALCIAEDKTGDFYKFSFSQWKRHTYDVKTLSELSENEITNHAFALLNKWICPVENCPPRTRRREFYSICIQDHQILKALRRDPELQLLPLLVYIFTHELVHIVRFCNFLERFETTGEKRDLEEKIVHDTTFKILRDLSLPDLKYVLNSYKDHRMSDSFDKFYGEVTDYADIRV